MYNYIASKQASDKYLPQVMAIICDVLKGHCAIADDEEDQERNTDLIWMPSDTNNDNNSNRIVFPERVAVRIRSYEYLKYSDEFSIRCQRRQNITELYKIIQGYGRYCFYGFANKEKDKVISWNLLDLNVFRIELVKNLITNKGKFTEPMFTNKDRSSKFRLYKYVDFPSELIIATNKGKHHAN